MSEYIEIETEMSEDGSRMHFYTNLNLTEEGVEEYRSTEAMEEGSPVAQVLSVIEGIAHLRIEDSEMIVRRDPEVPWHVIVA
ncbi:MAG TPA: hypothetical protein VF177_06480, partial [Anaerolineae bacterium]